MAIKGGNPWYFRTLNAFLLGGLGGDLFQALWTGHASPFMLHPTAAHSEFFNLTVAEYAGLGPAIGVITAVTLGFAFPYAIKLKRLWEIRKLKSALKHPEKYRSRYAQLSPKRYREYERHKDVYEEKFKDEFSPDDGGFDRVWYDTRYKEYQDKRALLQEFDRWCRRHPTLDGESLKELEAFGINFFSFKRIDPTLFVNEDKDSATLEGFKRFQAAVDQKLKGLRLTNADDAWDFLQEIRDEFVVEMVDRLGSCYYEVEDFADQRYRKKLLKMVNGNLVLALDPRCAQTLYDFFDAIIYLDAVTLADFFCDNPEFLDEALKRKDFLDKLKNDKNALDLLKNQSRIDPKVRGVVINHCDELLGGMGNVPKGVGAWWFPSGVFLFPDLIVFLYAGPTIIFAGCLACVITGGAPIPVLAAAVIAGILAAGFGLIEPKIRKRFFRWLRHHPKWIPKGETRERRAWWNSIHNAPFAIRFAFGFLGGATLGAVWGSAFGPVVGNAAGAVIGGVLGAAAALATPMLFAFVRFIYEKISPNKLFAKDIETEYPSPRIYKRTQWDEMWFVRMFFIINVIMAVLTPIVGAIAFFTGSFMFIPFVLGGVATVAAALYIAYPIVMWSIQRVARYAKRNDKGLLSDLLWPFVWLLGKASDFLVQLIDKWARPDILSDDLSFPVRGFMGAAGGSMVGTALAIVLAVFFIGFTPIGVGGFAAMGAFPVLGGLIGMVIFGGLALANPIILELIITPILAKMGFKDTSFANSQDFDFTNPWYVPFFAGAAVGGAFVGGIGFIIGMIFPVVGPMLGSILGFAVGTVVGMGVAVTAYYLKAGINAFETKRAAPTYERVGEEIKAVQPLSDEAVKPWLLGHDFKHPLYSVDDLNPVAADNDVEEGIELDEMLGEMPDAARPKFLSDAWSKMRATSNYEELVRKGIQDPLDDLPYSNASSFASVAG